MPFVAIFVAVQRKDLPKRHTNLIVRILPSLDSLLLFRWQSIGFCHRPTGSVQFGIGFSAGVENGWLPRVTRRGSSM